jgi:hypothetical protein
MGDYAIKARLEVESTPDDVRRWLDSPEGLAGWWSDSVEGDAGRVGGTIQVRFPTTPVTFELVVSELSDDVVEWRVPESPPWWKGTTIRFEVSEDAEGKSAVRFTHGGFDSDDPIIEVITPAWIRFLDNLSKVAASGVPSPAVVN